MTQLMLPGIPARRAFVYHGFEIERVDDPPGCLPFPWQIHDHRQTAYIQHHRFTRLAYAMAWVDKQ